MEYKETVANTILDQLGGRKFTAMTGARNYVAGERSLHMDLPGSLVKAKGNRVVIELNLDDTYSVTLYRVRRGELTTLGKAVNLYCDCLKDAFEHLTGLRTSL